DFEAEAAYQWGDAGQVGFLFKPFLYGDDGADYDSWALNLELGYTFDMAWQPRVFLGFAYLGGEDNRDINWFEWWWPFDRPEASVSFNRLFSNWEYSDILDSTELSNVMIYRGGVSASPTEAVDLKLLVSYFEALDTFDSPVYFDLGRFRIPIAPALSFWTDSNDSSLGWEVELMANYRYSEDLSFEAGWAHLFTGDGLADGNFNSFNGLLFNGGSDSDDADYLYLETRLSF
ncbi:MAG TPA: alginate export family protein, partial [Candidatus Hydrogenedentes bacterium]|nr:alginate export family protein [Candidatus Hydrogenedentota bacterium]